MVLEALNSPKLSRDERKKLLSDSKKRLSVLGQAVKKKGLPVVVLFEGYGASGKGTYISELILNWDPREFKTFSFTDPEPSEARRPWLWRFWRDLPEYGKIAVFDRSWYRPVTADRIDFDTEKAAVERMIKEINVFERQLTDDGYLIVKIFLSVSREEQAQRLEKLRSSPDTAWRVTKRDLNHNKKYKELTDAFDEALTKTNTPNAPWHVVDASDSKQGIPETFKIVADAIENALSDSKPRELVDPEESVKSFPMRSVLKLSDADLTRAIDEDDYKKKLNAYVAELSELHNVIYRRKIPVIIGYEGWDAAGKGGSIKRLARAFDARGYEVIPVAAPTQPELKHQYLWRFWNSLPKDGHIAIFDRTWYGRVMVERVEGLCPEERWRQAYREINEFEKTLHNWGAVVVKYWVHIDSDEQLRRFKAREETEDKRWKINDEDWRNREKWAEYEKCVDDMLRYTNTTYAPWYILESNDKKYARLKALKLLINELKEAVDR